MLQPPPGFDVQLGNLNLIKENAIARYQYAEALSHAYGLLESNTMPGAKDAAAVPRDRLLRCLHVALAAEVFKATELLAGLCKYAMEAPDSQFMLTMNLNQTAAGDFFDMVPANPPDEMVRSWLPLMDPRGLPLTPDQQAAVDEADRAVCDLIRQAVLMAKEARTFLLKFRNRFSHTYGLILFGTPASKTGETFVMNLADKMAKTADGKLVMFNGVLISSKKTNASLLAMLQVMIEAEELLLRARAQAFLHSTPSLLPQFHYRKSIGVEKATVLAGEYEAARKKLEIWNLDAKLEYSFEIKPEFQTAADAFYKLPVKFGFLPT